MQWQAVFLCGFIDPGPVGLLLSAIYVRDVKAPEEHNINELTTSTYIFLLCGP
jgi:hypothetical protein